MPETTTITDARSDRNQLADHKNDPSEKMTREAMDSIGSVVRQIKDSPHTPAGIVEADGSLNFGHFGSDERDGTDPSGGMEKHNRLGEAQKHDTKTQGDPTAPYDASGVDQGKYGDCVFEATLAANAKTGAVQDMIATNPDGSFTVTFPGDSQHPVNVTAADLGQYGTTDSAQWARVAETAMIKQYPAFSQGGGMPADAPGGTDGNKPTPAQYAMYLLTGNTAPKIDATDSSAANQIQTSLDAGQPVVAFCKDDDKGALVSGHEWTVEKYDPATGKITVRNPWGSNPSSDPSESGVTNLGNGEVQMSLETFQKHYGEVTFGTAPSQTTASGLGAGLQWV